MRLRSHGKLDRIGRVREAGEKVVAHEVDGVYRSSATAAAHRLWGRLTAVRGRRTLFELPLNVLGSGSPS